MSVMIKFLGMGDQILGLNDVHVEDFEYIIQNTTIKKIDYNWEGYMIRNQNDIRIILKIMEDLEFFTYKKHDVYKLITVKIIIKF